MQGSFNASIAFTSSPTANPTTPTTFQPTTSPWVNYCPYDPANFPASYTENSAFDMGTVLLPGQGLTVGQYLMNNGGYTILTCYFFSFSLTFSPFHEIFSYAHLTHLWLKKRNQARAIFYRTTVQKNWSGS